MRGNAYYPQQPFHVDLEFSSDSEARDLREELTTWTPSGGWSENAVKLFKLLDGNYEGTDLSS